jgi:hypothetical protein
MAAKKIRIADRVWRGSHRYGCKCDGDHESGGGREKPPRYTDGSVGACDSHEPCPTASVEWNAVRASFASALALKPLSKIASNLEELATAPIMGTDREALSSVASAIQALAEAGGEPEPR